MRTPYEILREAKTVAVVGCSATPGKDAHEIPKFLTRYKTIIPVNPSAPEIFGLKAYKTLEEVPGPIDLVNVFRPSEEAPAIVRQAIKVGAKGVWLQTGLSSEEARRLAHEAGIDYVEGACTRVVQQLLLA